MKKSNFITKLTEELEFDSELDFDTNIKDHEEWDSMAAMVLIGFVSDHFNVILNADDIKEISTVQSIIDKIGADKFE